AALEDVGLSDRLSSFPSALSGGQQQRVAIARAVVKRPPLLLADEPTGALDLETGRQVLGHLHRTSRQYAITVMLVTHNSAIATMADRVVHLRSGAIVGDERNEAPTPPEEVTW
ncbi:MAG: ATP-binding cassette domain-containing protein, partial [Actinobacteria bacterium]|nr:ATP-binding cassette domain-containing protein [Actinomycetota bacterium]